MGCGASSCGAASDATQFATLPPTPPKALGGGGIGGAPPVADGDQARPASNANSPSTGTGTQVEEASLLHDAHVTSADDNFFNGLTLFTERRIDHHAIFQCYDTGNKGYLGPGDVQALHRDLKLYCTQQGIVPELVSTADHAVRCLAADSDGLVTPWMLIVNFGRLMYAAARDAPRVMRPPILIVADPGPDPDDVKVIILAAKEHIDRVVDIKGIICNGGHCARERTALARCVLRQVDSNLARSRESIPIMAGSAGKPYKHMPHEYNIDGFEHELQQDLGNGHALCVRVLEEAAPMSLIIQIQAGFTDIADLIKEQPVLFEEKVAWCSLMGGLKLDDAESNTWVPDSAQNNVFDLEAATLVYEFCIAKRIPMNVVSRESVPSVAMSLVRDLRDRSNHKLMEYLYDAQMLGLVGLWGKVCGKKLPARCNTQWYFTTFCGVTVEEYQEKYIDLDGDAELDIAPYLNGTIKPYDVLCFMLNLNSCHSIFNFVDARVVINGMSHHLFITKELMPEVEPVYRLLDETFSLISVCLHHNELQLLKSDNNPEKPVWAAANNDDDKMAEAVLKLLSEKWPLEKNSSLLETWRRRDELMRDTGPQMVVVHWKTLQRLGRIPRSDENESLTLSQAAAIASEAGVRFFLEMFSHRWCSKDNPDDSDNSKAKSLVEWAKYRWANGLGSFFWIDYACIDQTNVSPGVTMLPLYAASCNNILCYNQIGYEQRSWCRIERTMFASFCAPTQDIIARNFKYSGEVTQKPVREAKLVLTNPVEGTLSYPGDMSIIRKLQSIATDQWGSCWKDGLKDLVKKQGIKGVEFLQVGVTQVRARYFI